MQPVDFARSSDKARRTINAWAERQTRGRVKDLLREGEYGDWRSVDHDQVDTLGQPIQQQRQPVDALAERLVGRPAGREDVQLLDASRLQGRLEWARPVQHLGQSRLSQ